MSKVNTGNNLTRASNYQNKFYPNYNSVNEQLSNNSALINLEQIEKNKKPLSFSDKINQTDLPMYYDKSPM